ncbi:MAG: hypothetical protein AAF995_07710 [Planctomycetota bacterium]
MDHGRSQGLGGDDYDALAELFLGTSGRADGRADEGELLVPVGTGQPVHAHERGGERLEQRVDDMRLTARASADEGGPAIRRRIIDETQEVCTELLVLGHLPVRASVWVKQYAASVARDLGRPVGLVRSAPSGSSIELVGVDARDAARIEEQQSVGAAMRTMAGVVDRCIVRGEETAEAWLVEQGGIDRVTVLSGSDEAAVVASYRLIKQLNATWDRVFGEGLGPELGLAVIGEDEGEAQAAGEKLVRAAGAFLSRAIVRTGVQSRVGSCPSALVYRGGSAIDWDAIVAGESKAITEPEDEWHGLRLALDDETDETDGPGEPAELRHAEWAEPAAAPAASIVEPKASEADRAGAAAEARSADVVSTRLRLAGRRPSVGAAVLPGLTMLEARCPYANGVRLASDDAGMLHLVAERDGVGESAKGAMDALIEAEGWVRAHLGLLLRAEPSLRVPSGSADSEGCGLHLVIDSGSARSVRGLLLDDRVRVHVRNAVVVDGHEVEITTAL